MLLTLNVVDILISLLDQAAEYCCFVVFLFSKLAPSPKEVRHHSV